MRSREEVFVEFGADDADTDDKVNAMLAAMADRIRALEARTVVRVLDEWRMVARDGTYNWGHSYWPEKPNVEHLCARFDEEFPDDAPHRVLRVALIDDTATDAHTGEAR